MRVAPERRYSLRHILIALVFQVSQGSHQDSKDFKAAVARTRQAVCVQKAIGFMDASSPAK